MEDQTRPELSRQAWWGGDMDCSAPATNCSHCCSHYPNPTTPSTRTPEPQAAARHQPDRQRCLPTPTAVAPAAVAQTQSQAATCRMGVSGCHMAGGWVSEFATVRWHLQQRNDLVQRWLRLSLCGEVSAHVQMSNELQGHSAPPHCACGHPQLSRQGKAGTERGAQLLCLLAVSKRN